METQYISLNMTPTGVNPCFHISQYDIGRPLGVKVHNGAEVVDLDSYTCTIEATRSDGVAITASVATNDNIGTFETTATMTNKADKYKAQFVIVDADSKRIASLPFDMDVCKAAMDENSESIEEDASLYQQYTEAVQGAIAEANADIQAEEKARIAAINAEATARANADATLQNNIDAEATARANAITAEATARQTADNTLQGNINSEASTRASADSNLQSQINQIIAPSGEAPSAAEVQNARIGADGVTYGSLGTAIRTQAGNLDDNISNGYNYIDDVLESELLVEPSVVDFNDFALKNNSAWKIKNKSETSITAERTASGSTNPTLSTTLNAGTYTFYADFSESKVKYITKVIGSAYTSMSNGDSFTINDDNTPFGIILGPSTLGTYTIKSARLIKGHGGVLKKHLVDSKRKFYLSGNKYINVDYTNMKVTIPAGYINVDNGARYATSAAELTLTDAYGFIYFDFSTNSFVRKTAQESTGLIDKMFVAMIPSDANGIPMADVPIAVNGVIVNRQTLDFLEKYGEKYTTFNIVAKASPITIDQNKRIIHFPRALFIVYKGVPYNITNEGGFDLDYKGNGSTSLKRVYFDISKINSLNNALSNNCFYIAEQTAPQDVGEQYILIALIPDAAQSFGNRPTARFEFVTNNEADRGKIIAQGFIPSVPAVEALHGENVHIVADDYDQFAPLIAMWDALVARANQYGTYMKKCWIDGTDYDNTQKIMSDLPTSGSHNPRGDMNQYPLLMYKLIPQENNSSYVTNTIKHKILISAGIHGGSSGGDHIESPVAIYYMAKRIVEEFYISDSLYNIRRNIEVDIIPCANPWGINNHQRVNGQNIDINRDFGDFQTVTAQQIKNLIDSGNYELYWDSHCLGGTSLISGDLTGANFYWISNGGVMTQLGDQILDFIGAKYSVDTEINRMTNGTAGKYAYNAGLVAVTTELPANTPAYYGDTVGDAHGEETVKRDVDFTQNIIAVLGNVLTSCMILPYNM